MEKEKLQALIVEENELLIKINTCSNVLDKNGRSELAHLSFQIINKLIHLHKDLIKIEDNQIHTFSIVRYVFETLINVKLLRKEPSYIFKLYYSIYNEQIRKTEILIDRLIREIDLIAKYEKLEEIEYSKLGNLGELSEIEIKAKMSFLDKEIAFLYKKASLEFTMFFEKLDFNGFTSQKDKMNRTLSSLRYRLEELKTLRSKKAILLSEDQRVKACFNGLNSDNFFALIKEARSWAEKARAVDLSHEYKQIYDYSSHFVHSLPYSLITSFEIDMFEASFTSSLIISYSYSIIDHIKTLLDIDKIFPFDVIVTIDGAE